MKRRPFETAFTKSKDGTRIYYGFRKGQKDKPALLFLHGIGGNSTAWYPSIEHFIKLGYTVAFFDQRGHGRSGKPNGRERYVFSKNLEDMDAVISAIGMNRFVLIGHSSGGMIALRYYRINPERVEAMVLFGSSYTNPLKYWGVPLHPFTPLIRGMFSMISWLASKARRKRFLYPNYIRYAKRSPLYIFYVDMLAVPIDMYFWSMNELFDFDEEELLSKIEIPVLLISGKKDMINKSKCSEKMHRLIPDSKLIVGEHLAHEALFKHPEAIYSIIEEFIDGR